MVQVVTSKKEKDTDEIVKVRVTELHTDVAGVKYQLRRGSERLNFKTDKGVETYFLRKHRWANQVKIAKPGDYPEHKAGNNWILSTGEEITGKDEAHRLEPTLK